MSNTAEALAALKTAEAELEAALAAEKVAPQPPAVPPVDLSVKTEPEVTSLPPVAPAAESVTAAGVTLGPEQIAVAKEFLSRGLAGATYHTADTPFSRGEDVPPSAEDFELPKWVELPNHLGPIPINGT